MGCLIEHCESPHLKTCFSWGETAPQNERLLFCEKTLLEALEVLRKPGAGDSSPGLQEDDFDRSVGSVGTQLSLNLNER